MDVRPALCVLVLSLIILAKRTTASEYHQSHRDSKFKYSNFVKHTHRILNATSTAIQKVPKASVCGLNCVNHDKCSSYNVAVAPDSNGDYECKLLTIVKRNGLKYNPEFNHYRIKSPCESSPCKNGATCVHQYEQYECGCEPGFFGKYCSHLVTSCQYLTNIGIKTDGVYTIRPDEQEPLKVYCDQTTDGGGWIVLQRRVSPFNTSFDRNWEDYKTGFGNLTGEFWLGNDNIHRLAATPVSFRVDLQENDGNKLHARYENFVVAGADDKYRWNMDSYSGDLANAIYGSTSAYHKVTGITTFDQDNDRYPSGNCAVGRAGFWFNWCGVAALNQNGGPKWARVTQEPYGDMSPTASEMKIRP